MNKLTCLTYVNCYLYILGERHFAPVILIQSHVAIKQVIWSSQVCANSVTSLFYCEKRGISLFFLQLCKDKCFFICSNCQGSWAYG